jgi:hypothetical protein
VAVVDVSGSMQIAITDVCSVLRQIQTQYDVGSHSINAEEKQIPVLLFNYQCLRTTTKSLDTGDWRANGGIMIINLLENDIFIVFFSRH